MASTISRERVCLNRRCSTSSSTTWRSGWLLSTGHFADLCYMCGLAFEQSRFCESFHLEDTGWRTCNSCGKRVHCGCVASLQAYACLDAGGIECKSCIERKGVNHTVNLKLLGSPQLSEHNTANRGSERARHLHPNLGNVVRANLSGCPELGSDAEDVVLAAASDISVPGATAGHEDSRDGTAEANQHTGLHDLFSTAPSNGDTQDDRPSGLGSFRSRPRQIVPRPAAARVETSTADAGSGLRAARLPVEGRGRTQLLPRYWPRITDKELQQISGSGDNKSTITPLFEKVLSASDAGRIGRLVLPKACAEAYFPQISQPEGVPMKIQDVTGKVWGFQFRFWPNNNSRMYVLEGVTPCIQKLQLQAGDTVTFSRMEPGGRLVMGYRRAPTSAASLVQDNLAANVGYGGDGTTPSSQTLSEGQNVLAKTSDATYKPAKVAKVQEKTADGAMLQQLFMYDWKRARPLGSKTKRLRIENEESVQLKSSWEEVQELLRPPLSCAPNLVSVEGHEFEEYEEPPVLAKKTFFTLRNPKWAGDDAVQCNDCDEIHMVEDQWARCDNCAIWRRVPADALIPSKWTCSENHWDPDRASCSEPQELTTDEIEHLLLTTGAEYMRQGVDGAVVRETTAVGLDALADAAALREEAVQVGAMPTSPSSPVRTTKHPRHRPGCTCIVCIQPPSGKGPKHKPNCICNVCVTVKRRFKTLMMRRKKREIDTHVRKRKAFQYGKDGVDGEQSRIGTSKPTFRIADNSNFGRLGVEMQEPSVPLGQGTSSSGIISRRIVDRDRVLCLNHRDEMLATVEDHLKKIPSVRLELGSDKSAATFSRPPTAGDDEVSWRTRPSHQIDLNMQPDVKPDDMHEKLEVDGEHGVAPHPWHTGPFYAMPASVKSMQPSSPTADGNSSRGRLEHPSCSRSQTRSPVDGGVKSLQIGEATSRSSAKGVESELGAQQAGQFMVSSFSNTHSMVAES